MKKRRKRPISHGSTPLSESRAGAPSAGEALHFRLCHVCLHLNESESDIEQCQKCSRCLTIEYMVEARLARRKKGGMTVRFEEDSDGDDIEDLSEDDFGEIHRFSGLNGLAVLW